MTREEINHFADEMRKVRVRSQEPKMGHWIDIMVGDMPAQACDQCNTFYPLAYTGGGHKYCPNCGAKMESEE
jgi:PHP family Zn ribbon phosphoesterase